MNKNEEILNLVRTKGPILPVKVSKEIKDDILMTSARLSELLSNKQIKVSHLKIGSSPLYYFSGQESKLQEFSDNLGGKEKEAYNLLKEKKLLRDSKQEPAIRVALREIKDFGVALQVNYNNKSEVFWRWYLTTNEEAQPLIKTLLTESDKETLDKQAIPKEQPKPIETQNEPIKEEESIRETPKPIEAETTKKQDIEQEKKIEIKKEKKKIDKTRFLKQIAGFFEKNKIDVKETNEIKKNSEMDYTIELESAIGKVKYFCKAKNKKKITEGDLSSALLQSKNHPLLFLSGGELTKKAKEMVDSALNNITFKKI